MTFNCLKISEINKKEVYRCEGSKHCLIDFMNPSFRLPEIPRNKLYNKSITLVFIAHEFYYTFLHRVL